MTTVVPHYDQAAQNYKIGGLSKTITYPSVLTKATARLKADTISGGTGPDGSLKPMGWYSGDCPTHHQRGHLVGNALGGTGDSLDNLVTLTAGSNHPFMYAIERVVNRYVRSKPLQAFHYEVTCGYSDYVLVEIAKGFWVPTVGNNPMCLFPAPASLTISLRHWLMGGPGAYISLGELCTGYEDPEAELGHGAATSTTWWIPNGGYKLNQGIQHTGSYCAGSVNLNTADKNQSAAFVAYATHLGYV